MKRFVIFFISLAVFLLLPMSASSQDFDSEKYNNQLAQYDFDYIFLDCPPNLGIIVTNALVAANEVIIPVKTDYLSYRGLELIKDSVAKVKSNKRMNPEIEVLGIIPTMYRGNINDHKDILNILEKQGKILGIVKESVSASKGDVDGVPAVVYNPRSDVAKAYFDIAKLI